MKYDPHPPSLLSKIPALVGDFFDGTVFQYVLAVQNIKCIAEDLKSCCVSLPFCLIFVPEEESLQVWQPGPSEHVTLQHGE